MVKKYPSSSKIILEAVKQNPSYSVDRLAMEIPGVSRNQVQRVLESYNLSRVSDRIAFSMVKEGNSSVPVKSRKVILDVADGVKRGATDVFLPLKEDRAYRRRFLLRSAVLGVGVLVVSGAILASKVVFADPVEIVLTRPEVDYVNMGEKLFVDGLVKPRGGKVVVNGKEVAQNGNGGFTAIVEIPVGQSVLEVEAEKWGKSSKIIRMVNRDLTQEELVLKQQTEEEEKKKKLDELAAFENQVNDVLAAKTATYSGESVRVLSSEAVEEYGYKFIVGEVINQGEKEVSLVTVEVKFLGGDGTIVDTKHGFATNVGETMSPGEQLEFKTQATNKPFEKYSLDVSWWSAENANGADSAEKIEGSEIGGDGVASESSGIGW